MLYVNISVYRYIYMQLSYGLEISAVVSRIMKFKIMRMLSSVIV